MTNRILQPGDIEPAAGAIPEVRLPPASGYFAARAARFAELAEGHALADWLRYLGRLAEAQDAELRQMPEVVGADAGMIALSREHGLPPLGPLGWKRDPVWRSVAHGIAARLDGQGPQAAQAIAARVAAADESWLQAQANLFLTGSTDGLDIAAAPLLAAALQVYWTRLASLLSPVDLRRLDRPNLCPACGSRPVASVVRIGGAEAGLRYLHCSLCETEWHMVRIKCSQCESTKGIGYHHLEGGREGLRAETCDECRSYLKIAYQERDPNVDPFADDLATLSLDLLLDEAGYARSGFDPLLIPGES